MIAIERIQIISMAECIKDIILFFFVRYSLLNGSISGKNLYQHIL